MQSQMPVGTLFSRSWDLLTKNPIILAPGIVIAVLIGLIDASLLAQFKAGLATASTGRMGAAATGAGVFALVTTFGIIAQLINQAWTAGMAGMVWQRGAVTLDDGIAAFNRNLIRIITALLLVAVISIVLGVFTFGLGFLVFLFFAFYFFPSVVVGGNAPVPALQESFRIATSRVVDTIVIILLLLVAGLVAGILSLPFGLVPVLGEVVKAIVVQVAQSFGMLVAVGAYLDYKASTAAAPVNPPPAS